MLPVQCRCANELKPCLNEEKNETNTESTMDIDETGSSSNHVMETYSAEGRNVNRLKEILP